MPKNSISDYYSAAQLRADRWSELREAVDRLDLAATGDAPVSDDKRARALAKAEELLEALAPIEFYWAFPGPVAFAQLRRMLAHKNFEDLSIAIRRVVRALTTGAYRRRHIPLIAEDDDADEIMGLNTGADDYLGKPVKPSILLARLRALLRRSQNESVNTVIEIGALMIDSVSRSVSLLGESIALSTHEFDVLLLLATQVGQPMSRDELISQIRGIEYDGFDRSVDICISRLRRRLNDDGQVPKRIKTLRGVGYLLAADAW